MGLRLTSIHAVHANTIRTARDNHGTDKQIAGPNPLAGGGKDMGPAKPNVSAETQPISRM